MECTKNLINIYHFIEKLLGDDIRFQSHFDRKEDCSYYKYVPAVQQLLEKGDYRLCQLITSVFDTIIGNADYERDIDLNFMLLQLMKSFDHIKKQTDDSFDQQATVSTPFSVSPFAIHTTHTEVGDIYGSSMGGGEACTSYATDDLEEVPESPEPMPSPDAEDAEEAEDAEWIQAPPPFVAAPPQQQVTTTTKTNRKRKGPANDDQPSAPKRKPSSNKPRSTAPGTTPKRRPSPKKPPAVKESSPSDCSESGNGTPSDATHSDDQNIMSEAEDDIEQTYVPPPPQPPAPKKSSNKNRPTTSSKKNSQSKHSHSRKPSAPSAPSAAVPAPSVAPVASVMCTDAPVMQAAAPPRYVEASTATESPCASKKTNSTTKQRKSSPTPKRKPSNKSTHDGAPVSNKKSKQKHATATAATSSTSESVTTTTTTIPAKLQAKIKQGKEYLQELQQREVHSMEDIYIKNPPMTDPCQHDFKTTEFRNSAADEITTIGKKCTKCFKVCFM